MDDKDVPTLDDDGEHSSYAKCSKCGAVENTDESIRVCPKAEYVHISALLSLFATAVEECKPKAQEQIPARSQAEHWGLTEGNLDRLAHNGEAIGYNKALSDYHDALIKKLQ